MSVKVKVKNKTVPQKTASRIRTLIARQYAVGDILPTHKELAVQLDVSHPSVAGALKVLAAQGYVNPVQRKGTVVIKRPSAVESSLSQIAVVTKGHLSTLFTGYRGEILSGLAGELDDRDMNLTLFPHQLGTGDVAPTQEIERMADGIVLKGALSERLIKSCMSTGVPLVMVDHYSPDSGVDSILCDNAAATFIVMNHLVGLGHKNVTYVKQSNEISYDSDSVERLDSFRSAVAELPLRQSGDIFEVPPDSNGRKVVISNIIDLIKKSDAPPTAIVTPDDHTANWLISELAENGINVPDDLSIITIAQASRADLSGSTHISGCIMNFNEMGVKAVKTLEWRSHNYSAQPVVVRVGFKLATGYTCRRVNSE